MGRRVEARFSPILYLVEKQVESRNFDNAPTFDFIGFPFALYGPRSHRLNDGSARLKKTGEVRRKSKPQLRNDAGERGYFDDKPITAIMGTLLSTLLFSVGRVVIRRSRSSTDFGAGSIARQEWQWSSGLARQAVYDPRRVHHESAFGG